MSELKLNVHYESNLKKTLNSNNPLLQVQRSPEAKIDDFLFEMGYLLKLLKPQINEKRILCNVGAGNGIHNLILYPFYQKIYCTDPIDKMINLAQYYCRNIHNIEYIVCSGEDVAVALDDKKVDDIVCMGVAGIVENKDIFFNIIKSCVKCINGNGRMILGRLSDINKKDAYISSLPTILKKKDFPDNEIEKIVQRNSSVNFYSYDEMNSFLKSNGAKTVIYHDENVQHIAHEMQFSLEIQF